VAAAKSATFLHGAYIEWRRNVTAHSLNFLENRIMRQQLIAEVSLVENQGVSGRNPLENGGDAPALPSPKRSSKLGRIWARFGAFFQDVCVQITSLLAAISVIDILQNEYKDTQCNSSCFQNINSPGGYGVPSGFSYPSAQSAPSPFVQFDSNFITKACQPTYGTSISDILSAFKAMVVLNQVVFTTVNVLKVRAQNTADVCITQLMRAVTGIASWRDLDQPFLLDSSLEEGTC